MVIKWVVAAASVVVHLDSFSRLSGHHVDAPIRWLAAALLFVMIAALIYTGRVVVRSFSGTLVVSASSWETFVIPMLALIGMVVAASLASDEISVVDPADDSAAVLNSSYARLFDIVPVSVMGQQAYTIVFWAGLWVFPRPVRSVQRLYRGILVLTIVGTLFSLYLTFLEVFVIRAAYWKCLLSAATMTLLMIVTLVPALQGTHRSRLLVLKRTGRIMGLVSRNGRRSNDRF